MPYAFAVDLNRDFRKTPPRHVALAILCRWDPPGQQAADSEPPPRGAIGD